MISGGDRYSYWGDYVVNMSENIFDPFLKLSAGKYLIKAKVRYGSNPI